MSWDEKEDSFPALFSSFSSSTAFSLLGKRVPSTTTSSQHQPRLCTVGGWPLKQKMFSVFFSCSGNKGLFSAASRFSEIHVI
jgi:hypothetical protein